MKIIERFIKGKRENQQLCEDGIFVSEDYIAVIDGVTSKGRQKWDGVYSSGGHAKNVILAALEKMPKDADKTAFFKTLDSALAAAYREQVQNDDITEYLRACIIVYSKSQGKIWSLGDCACIINGQRYETPKRIDTLTGDLRALVIESALKDGKTLDSLRANDIGRAAIVPFLNGQLRFENDEQSDFGYGVLNGHGANINFVKEYGVSAGDTVVLASDGYPELCDSLEESERRLSELLAADPFCFRQNRGTKGTTEGNCSFDDRAYIKFEV